MPNLASWMPARLQDIETALSDLVPEKSPALLGQTMRYAVLDGGKRLRPLLMLAVFDSFATPSHQQDPAWRDLALRSACALELMHAYSLVHDDLPCMDNDVLRRGKPTVHVVYGQAQALLAGDALQALAFELIVTPSVDAATQVQLVKLLASASGQFGMAGGQAIDLASVSQKISETELRHMHQLKTGALLHASVMMGADCAQVGPQREALSTYGQTLGLLFQVVDDILDVVADSAVLGKTAGKDAVADKPTYASHMGLSAAQAYATELHAEAKQALSQLTPNALLLDLLDWVAGRSY